MATRERQPDSVRLFALNASLRSICGHWKALGQQDREQVKEAALEILWEGLQDQEARFIKAKVSSILVELAKRSWPQEWTNFLSVLENAAAKSIGRAELVLRTLRDLTEDCTNSDFNSSLSPGRRSDIMQGLRAALDELLQLVFRLLESAHAGAREAASQGGGTALEENMALATATLGALQLLADLAPVQSLMNHNLVSAVSAFAHPIAGIPASDSARGVQKAAWQCVAALAEKSTSDRNTTVDMLGYACSVANVLQGSFQLVPLRGTVQSQRDCAALDAVWPLFALANDDSTGDAETTLLENEDVHFLQARAVTQITSQYFAQLLTEADANRANDGPRAREALESVMRMLLQMLCQPGVRVRAACVNGMLAAVRAWSAHVASFSSDNSTQELAPCSTGREGCALLESYLMLLWRCLADHVIALGAPDSPASSLWPAAAFALESFDDHEDFMSALDGMRTQTLLVMQSLTKLCPEQALQFWRLRVSLACVPPSSPPDTAALGAGVRALQVQLDDATFFAGSNGASAEQPELESPRQAYVTSTLVWLVDGILRDVPKKIFEQFGHLNQLGGQASATRAGQGAVELRLGLETVLGFSERAVGDALGVLHVLSRLSKCYAAVPDGPSLFLFPVLNKMFSCATFHKATEQGSEPYSVETLSIRRRAGSALLEICTQLSEGGASSPEIRAHMATLLPKFCENVLQVLNESGTRIENQEKIVLHEVLVVVSNTLPSGEEQDRFVGELVAQPLRVWTSPEVTQMASSPERLAAALRQCGTGDDLVQESRRALALMLAMARRSKGRSDHVRPFARYWRDVLPNMFTMLRSLHGLSREREKYQDVLYVHPDEMRVLMGKFGGTNCSWPDSANNLHTLHAMSQLREVLYSGLGRAAKYRNVGVFALPQASELLSEAMLSNLEVLENRAVYRLIQGLVVPCIMHCPDEYVDGFLLPVVQRFVSHLFMRLDRSWPLLQGEQPRVAVDPHWHATLDVTIDFATDAPDAPATSQTACSSRTCGICPRCQQSDILRDATIRALSTGLVDVLSPLLKTIGKTSTDDPRKVLTNAWVLAGAPNGVMPDEFSKTIFDYSRATLQDVHQHLLDGVPGMDHDTIRKAEEAIAAPSTDKARRQRCKDFVWKCIFEVQPESMRPHPTQNPFNSKARGGEIEIQNLGGASGGVDAAKSARKKHEQHAFFDRASQWVNAADASDLGVQSLFSSSSSFSS
ncbi:Exportin-5 [Hondaea fermentalgiana]|uniref:Exportin-5 n=1 Tax=Hondaea fermentalgiana TaxID=2315210 RepID=A0A2R5GEK8_9STRA|nr:Exportin-5 [Hondaea fermentalgiana]|eukprot:GBG26254.1 Exportin-5 [Hondaea fermentalgiana]